MAKKTTVATSTQITIKIGASVLISSTFSSLVVERWGRRLVRVSFASLHSCTQTSFNFCLECGILPFLHHAVVIDLVHSAGIPAPCNCESQSNAKPQKNCACKGHKDLDIPIRVTEIQV